MTDPKNTPDTSANANTGPGTESTSTLTELPDPPEDYELQDGSTVTVATDVEHYGYAENPQDRPRTVVPFAVQVIAPDGHVTEVECDDVEQSHNVHSLVCLLDQLGYRRG